MWWIPHTCVGFKKQLTVVIKETSTSLYFTKKCTNKTLAQEALQSAVGDTREVIFWSDLKTAVTMPSFILLFYYILADLLQHADIRECTVPPASTQEGFKGRKFPILSPLG